jgi:hypothetical protein
MSNIHEELNEAMALHGMAMGRVTEENALLGHRLNNQSVSVSLMVSCIKSANEMNQKALDAGNVVLEILARFS